MIQSRKSNNSYDLIVVGGGILGLWAARHAIKRGKRVILIEKRQIGSGASGGFLGALMPHMPDNWNGKKQLQYDGLSTIARSIKELEMDTKVGCEFRRCGRIMPLTHEKVLPQVQRRIAGACENWASSFGMSHSREIDTLMHESDVSNLDLKFQFENSVPSHGIQHDTLTARVNPRAYIGALAAYVRPNAAILEGHEVVSLETTDSGCRVSLSGGDAFSADKIVVANGWEAYPLLKPYFASMNDGKQIGRGVKGQAILVEIEHNDTWPILYHDGTYIVPHSANRVAIGSASRKDWSGEPNGFDFDDMEFYHKALSLVPALKDAPIIERWAGVRPRNTLAGRGTSPWFGRLPDMKNIIALIGGFKITLGVAHLDFVRSEFVD